MSEEQSKSSISHTCRRVLLKAESRRYGKTVMYVKNVNVKPMQDEDDIDADDDEEDDDEEDDDEADFDGYAGQPSKKPKLGE